MVDNRIYRRHGLSFAAAWDLPTDPFTMRIGGFARWASAIDPNGPWWLRDVLTLGASLSQHVDVRKGRLVVEGSVAWVENDLGSSWLPVVATFLAPGAPSVNQQPPLRIEAGLSYAF